MAINQFGMCEKCFRINTIDWLTEYLAGEVILSGCCADDAREEMDVSEFFLDPMLEGEGVDGGVA
jgi:hypothetical protein